MTTVYSLPGRWYHRGPGGVVKDTVFLLAASCLLIGSCKGGGDLPQDGGRAVEIVLQDVTVRQYSGPNQRFLFETKKLRLDEETGVLEAPEGVRGRIEAGAFGEERNDK
jgi:hypothetical protein